MRTIVCFCLVAEETFEACDDLEAKVTKDRKTIRRYTLLTDPSTKLHLIDSTILKVRVS